MDRIGNLMAQPEREPGSNAKKYLPKPRQLKLVSALWQRMSQLFPGRWESNQGSPKAGGSFSENFLFWSKKTERLTDEQWRRGFDKLEFNVKQASKDGKVSWPPSYAEFLGMCESCPGWSMHKKNDPIGLPEPKQARKGRVKEGRKQCANILSILGSG